MYDAPEILVKVAFYGGSFNPPHVAHVMAVSYALSVGWAEKVLVVPVFEHAFAKRLESFEHRFAMVELCMGWLPGVTVSRVEADLPKPSRTLATLEYLKEVNPEQVFSLLMGADQLPEFEKWHGATRLKELAPQKILGRVGVVGPEAPEPVLPGISSTRVRKLLRVRHEPAARGELELSLPQSVLAYIDEHQLYLNG